MNKTVQVYRANSSKQYTDNLKQARQRKQSKSEYLILFENSGWSVTYDTNWFTRSLPYTNINKKQLTITVEKRSTIDFIDDHYQQFEYLQQWEVHENPQLWMHPK